MQTEYRLTSDPIYYVAVVAFALLTTALPAILGQPRFLPVAQTLALTVFTGVCLYRHNFRAAIRVMTIWLVVQFLLIFVLTLLVAGQIAYAMPDGVDYHAHIITWFFAGGALPRGFADTPITRVAELVGVFLGSFITGGLIGNWFLVRVVNLTAFTAAVLVHPRNGPASLVFGVPLWSLLRISGFAGLNVILAEALLLNHWSPTYYWRTHRRLLLWSTTLVVAGVLLELLLAPYWNLTRLSATSQTILILSNLLSC